MITQIAMIILMTLSYIKDLKYIQYIAYLVLVYIMVLHCDPWNRAKLVSSQWNSVASASN